MPAAYNYDKINLAFEKAVVQLQENLQYLSDEEKVSDRFISMQNSIIKALINYQHQTETLIGYLEWEMMELVKGNIKEIEQLKNTQESLEAICIIHGIMDFPIWMNKEKNYLINQAVTNYQENTMTLPGALKEKIDQLPKEEKEVVNQIL